jgi:transcription antitermination protein NusB
MLSRRNVRIKVMQLLYAGLKDSDFDLSKMLISLKKYPTELQLLYFANIYYTLKVAEYAKLDNETRKNKHLPSQEDKDFKPVIFENPVVNSILESISYKKLYSRFDSKIEIVDADIRIFYNEILKEKEYIEYATSTINTEEDNKKFLLLIYKTLNQNELFNELMEDLSALWLDDKSLTTGIVKKMFKALPELTYLMAELDEDDKETFDFGEKLIVKLRNKSQDYIDIIKPSLQNWDIDRLADLDLIFIQMALCEFLEFPSIPTKVTINEYVDIAKHYSTDKSKEFINGILDRLMKKLTEEKRIEKEGRGLME